MRRSSADVRAETLLSANDTQESAHNRSFHALKSLLDQVAKGKRDGSRSLHRIKEKSRKPSHTNLPKSPDNARMSRQASNLRKRKMVKQASTSNLKNLQISGNHESSSVERSVLFNNRAPVTSPQNMFTGLSLKPMKAKTR